MVRLTGPTRRRRIVHVAAQLRTLILVAGREIVLVRDGIVVVGQTLIVVTARTVIVRVRRSRG